MPDSRLDPVEEIFASKLCALLGRAEVRDLVDVRALEMAGHSLEAALAAAMAKDAGMTRAQLAWVLSEWTIGPDATPPGGVSPAELERFRAGLVERLVRGAAPPR